MTCPTKIAVNIVNGILSDIKDRKGLKQEWENIDEEIQDEIKEEWSKIIIENLPNQNEIMIGDDVTVASSYIFYDDYKDDRLAVVGIRMNHRNDLDYELKISGCSGTSDGWKREDLIKVVKDE